MWKNGSESFILLSRLDFYELAIHLLARVYGFEPGEVSGDVKVAASRKGSPARGAITFIST